MPVPYNGSVARLSFGPVIAARVRRWLREGRLRRPPRARAGHARASRCSRSGRPRARSSRPSTPPTSGRARCRRPRSILRPSLEKITARIAVSELRPRLQVEHLGGEPVVIPNGVYVDRLRRRRRPSRSGAAQRRTVAFLGRYDEPRKGFRWCREAFAGVAADRPGLRLLVVGGGDLDRARARCPRRCATRSPSWARLRRGQGRRPALRRRLLRAQHPGRELRHRARRGDGRRRPGGGQRPRRVRARARRRPLRRAVPPRGRRRPRRPAGRAARRPRPTGRPGRGSGGRRAALRLGKRGGAGASRSTRPSYRGGDGR